MALVSSILGICFTVVILIGLVIVASRQEYSLNEYPIVATNDDYYIKETPSGYEYTTLEDGQSKLNRTNIKNVYTIKGDCEPKIKIYTIKMSQIEKLFF